MAGDVAVGRLDRPTQGAPSRCPAERIEAAVADCRSVADQRGVEVVVETPQQAVGIDRVWLEVAVRNLVTDAVRFSPERL